jgi:hypothetical protein
MDGESDGAIAADRDRGCQVTLDRNQYASVRMLDYSRINSDQWEIR